MFLKNKIVDLAEYRARKTFITDLKKTNAQCSENNLEELKAADPLELLEQAIAAEKIIILEAYKIEFQMYIFDGAFGINKYYDNFDNLIGVDTAEGKEEIIKKWLEDMNISCPVFARSRIDKDIIIYKKDK